MFTSQNTLQRAAIAALTSGALWTAGSPAQDNPPVTPTAAIRAQAAAAQTATGAQNQNPVTQGLGLSFANNNSLTISQIANTSPLSGIGLQAGDQIMSVNGRPAGNGTNLLNDLSRLAGGGQGASITVMNSNGTRQTLNVPASALQSIVQARSSGGSPRPVTPDRYRAAQQNMLSQSLGASLSPSAHGLTVTALGDNSPLQGLGLQVGDQITGINNQAIGNATELLNRLTAAAQNQTNADTTLGVIRNGSQANVQVPTTTLQAITQARNQFNTQTVNTPTVNTPTVNTPTLNTPTTGTTQTTLQDQTGTTPPIFPINPSGPPFPGQTAGTTPTANTPTVNTQTANTPPTSTTQTNLQEPNPTGTTPPIFPINPSGAPFPGQTAGNTPTANTPTVNTQTSNTQTANTPPTSTTQTNLQEPNPTGTTPPIFPINSSGPPFPGRSTPQTGAGSTANSTTANPRQTTDQRAAVSALSGFQAPASGTTGQAGATANGNANESLPTAVITPSGPKIMMPGQAQGQGRGNASGGVPPANAKGAPGGGKAQGKSGGAHPNGGAHGGGGAAGAAKVGAS